MIFTAIVTETKTKILSPISNTGAEWHLDKFEYFQYYIVQYILTGEVNNISYLASLYLQIYLHTKQSFPFSSKHNAYSSFCGQNPTAVTSS